MSSIEGNKGLSREFVAMPQYQSEPPRRPRLRPHRLVPAGAQPPDEGKALSIEPVLETWVLEPGVALPPEIAEGGRALAQRAWLVIEKAALTLDAAPAVLKAADAPEEALETLKVIGSVLLALPDQLAAGLDTSIARADRLFARLLNAPGQPGLIEQVMLALVAAGAASQEPADFTAELEILRGLHRDLVALQQEWDDLLAPLFPEDAEPSPPDDALRVGVVAAPGERDNEAPGLAAPLPDGLVITVPASERSRQSRYIRGQNLLRLALLLSLLLFSSGTAALMLRQGHLPALNPGGAVLAVGQQTSATATSQPTPPQPTSTTAPSPSPTATPHHPTTASSPTPNPTSAASCLPAATFCASVSSLRVPCLHQGSVSFQLTNITTQQQDWLALPSIGHGGKPLVSITPSSGHLKPHQTLKLTVQASASGDHLDGTITILGSFKTLPVVIALAVCS
jgi:hypothetical protein